MAIKTKPLGGKPTLGTTSLGGPSGLKLSPAALKAAARAARVARAAALGGAAAIAPPATAPIIFVDMGTRAAEATGRKPKAPLLENTSGERDPFFKAVRDRLLANELIAPAPANPNDWSATHIGGKLKSQQNNQPLTDADKRLAAIYGLMQLEGATDPEVEDRFASAFTEALTEYSENKDVFQKVLDTLIENGTLGTTANPKTHRSEVRTDWWASVTRKIVLRGIEHEDPHLDEVSSRVLVDLRAADGGITPSAIEIDLPILQDSATVEVVPENLFALQAVYFAAMLEELRVFQVVDRLIELFHQGMLPLGRGRAGDILYRYWKESEIRLTEPERRNLYSRAFGFTGGDPTVPGNREFSDLWLRFVSSVSSYVRQNSLEQLLTRSIPAPISQEALRRSGRDLAANLSLHGYGIAFYAATELQTQVKEIIELLSNPEIKNAFGARDMFQVIDQVATLELGGARNGIRYRTLANSGAIIIRWLANKRHLLTSSNLPSVLDHRVLRRQNQVDARNNPTKDPTDLDLVNACEQWLAVTGTPDQKVEEYAEPSEPPMMTSRPVQIPSIARDALEAAGISFGVPPNGNRARANGHHSYGR